LADVLPRVARHVRIRDVAAAARLVEGRPSSGEERSDRPRPDQLNAAEIKPPTGVRSGGRTLRRRGGRGALVAEETADEGHGLARALGIGREGLEPISAQLGPARNLDERAALVEVVEDGMRVDDEVPSYPLEQTVDGGRI